MSPLPTEAAPYLGSRPFERTEEDRRRFFGRTREVEELSSLILSHNVVLLYAASGVGKSSLLDAGVVPELIAEGFEILPRGRVGILFPIDDALDGESNPYVVNLLCSLSPEADVRSLLHVPLADYLRGRPRQPEAAGRVIVIDQAEELFTFTPKDWQARQKEFFVSLRDALRDERDLRVIIAAREDYLARFDDLAPILPDGLRVRFHLEALGREAALQAVEGPLASTRRRFDTGVAEQLISDLSRTTIAMAAGTREEPGPHVEPVQLQIVCSALWNKLPEDVVSITAEHLHEFGDVEETLKQFYVDTIDACVEATRHPRETLSRWFGDKLITPSDTRGQVFQGLTETEGLPNQVVAFLEARHLLRADERASGRWYELAHDRLIHPIRTVNEKWHRAYGAVRARRQMRRRIARWAGATVTAALLVSGVAAVLTSQAHDRDLEQAKARTREYELAVRPADELRAECKEKDQDDECSRKKVRVFDFVADYYLRQDKVDDLVKLMKGAADLIPTDYGMVLSTSPDVSDAADEPGTLRIAYNPDRPVGEWRLRAEWARIANDLAETWGLPVSPRVALAPDRRVPLQSVQITATPPSCASATKPAAISLAAVMPARDREALISLEDIGKNVRLSAFFQKYSVADGWQEYRSLRFAGPWWFVPAWTLPIWRVGGQPAVSREAVLAVVLANEVLRHPEIVMSCDALHAILRKASAVAPDTVTEAISARTLEGLRNDFIELVRRQGRTLKDPSMLLDSLANYPRVSSTQAAEQADKEQASATGQQDSLQGPWSHRAAFEADRPTTVLDKQLSQGKDCRVNPVVVEMSEALKGVFIADDGTLNESTLVRMQQIRGTVYRRFGVEAPGVRFRASDADGLKITVLNQGPSNPDTKPFQVTTADATARLVEEVEQRFREFRTWWVTADTISSALDMIRAEERAWLQRRYSLTDLKQIARATIASDASDDDEDGGNSLRDLPWLLRSLTFWANAIEGPDIEDLAASLRATQQARRSRPDLGAHQRSGRSAALVRAGLSALDSGRPAQAATWFSRAIRHDRSAAIEAFLAGYGKLSSLGPARRVATLSEACRISATGRFATIPSTTAYEIEEFLANDHETVSSPARRHFELCLAEVDRARNATRAVRARLATLLAEVPIEQWNEEEALYLGWTWLLANHQATTPPDAVGTAKLLLQRGSLHRSPTQLWVVWKRLKEGLGENPWHWSRALMADFASDLPPDPKGPRWDIAEWLNDFGELEAQRAVRVLDGLDAHATARERWGLRWARARFTSHLGEYGDATQRAARLDDAARQLQKLLEAVPDPRLASAVAFDLAHAHVRRGDVANARRTIAEATRSGRNLDVFDNLTFWVAVGDGALDEARTVAARMVHRDPKDITNVFVNAALATLTRSDDFETAARAFLFRDEKKPHSYVDYIRLMLFWALSEDGRYDEAKQLLDERLRGVRMDTWPARLQQHDSMVWREMLVAHFSGAVSEASLFAPLHDDAAFRASGLQQTELGLDGLRCEAFFYTALHERVTGPRESRDQRFRAKLQLALETKQYGFLEYRMARFLLQRQES